MMMIFMVYYMKIFSSHHQKNGNEKYLPAPCIDFYDALNDDFNLINNVAFKAVDDVAIESVFEIVPIEICSSQFPRCIQTNICLSFNKQFRKELI